MNTIAVVAHKGGVGKTTTTVQLALALQRHHGKRVLVVDLDHQGSATALLGTEGEWPGTREVLLGEVPLAAAVRAGPSGVEVVAGTPALEGLDLEIANTPGREALLKQALSAAPPDRWDLCLLDTPPTLGLLTVNALVAASVTLAPVQAAFLSLRALSRLEATLAAVQVELNPDLLPLGYLLCGVNLREAITTESRQMLKAHAGPALWRSEVRVDSKLKAAPGTVRRGRGTTDYEAAAAELLRRIRRLP